MHGLNPSTASAYRQAFMKRRCLIPVEGFYEWKKVPGGKNPYSIGMKDNSAIRVCRDCGRMERPPANGEWLHTTHCIRFPISLLLAISASPITLGNSSHLHRDIREKNPCFINNYDSLNPVAVLFDVRYRQRVQKRLTRLRQTPPRFCNQSQSRVLRPPRGGSQAGCFPARIPPEAANLHEADAESGMQTRHDPLPCGMCYWKILTDQKQRLSKSGGPEPTCTGLHSRMFSTLPCRTD